MWSPTASPACTILLLHVLLLIISNTTTSTPTTFIPTAMPQMAGAARHRLCSSLLCATTASRLSSPIVGALRLRRSQGSGGNISGHCSSLVRQQQQQQIARLSAFRHDDDRKAMLWWMERKEKKKTQVAMARGPAEKQKSHKQPHQTVSKTAHLDAIFAVYKPQGWSSSNVVQKIKVCCSNVRCVHSTVPYHRCYTGYTTRG